MPKSSPRATKPKRKLATKPSKPQGVKVSSVVSSAPSPSTHKPSKVARKRIQGLSVKQWRFIDAYLNEASGNAHEAARIAGYGNSSASTHVQAVRLMQDKNILAILDKAATLHGLSANMTIHKLCQIVQANIGDFLAVNPDGTLLYDDKDRPKFDLERARKSGKLHLIESLKIAPDGYVTISLPKRTEALALMAKYHGLLVDRIEIEQRPDAERVRLELVEKLTRGMKQMSESDRAILQKRLPPPNQNTNGDGGEANTQGGNQGEAESGNHGETGAALPPTRPFPQNSTASSSAIIDVQIEDDESTSGVLPDPE